jgi:uncharacterized protein YbjQ (UPF0145 family)
MSKLEKYIQMLDSPKANTRYDACKLLRVSKESSAAAVLALDQVTQDPEKRVADAAKHALEAEVHLVMISQLVNLPPNLKELVQRKQQEYEKINKKIQKEKELSKIVIVTTPSLDGKRISEYLGIVSAEVVIGTGFLNEFEGNLANIFGETAGVFQDKLKIAKDSAMAEIREKAYELHADAIIGADLDYAVLSKNMLMVVANGTAVRLEYQVNK